MDAGGHAGAGRTGGNGSDGYRFGPFLIDVAAYVLSRDGEPQALEPKAFAVLLHLLRHAGELVRHEDLLDAVWGHRHVTPGVLTRAIAQLRHVLDDDSHRPRYIQTQHGLGYRFIGELTAWPQAAGAPARAQVAPAAETISDVPPALPASGDTHRGAAVDISTSVGVMSRTPGRRGRRVAWLAAALLLVGSGAWLLFHRIQLRPPTQASGASIAVLPFTSLSDERKDSYFAEGLAVELHDALSGVPGLKVAACRTESVCGTRGADVRRIGKLLGVTALLDADVRREGQRVRINARLTDTHTGYTLWSGSYDRELTGVFALQREIADEVVSSLPGIKPGDSDAWARRLEPTRSVAAYDAYLKGVQQLRGRRDGAAAIGFFSEALAADAGFARAQAGICRAEIVAFEGSRDSAAYLRAEAACQRAAQMDPTLREVNLALGDLHEAHGEPAQAIEYYKQALEDQALKPDAYLGMARAEATQKRSDVALDYFERARQLRPGDAAIYRSLGFHHYVNGDLRKAIDTYRVATELEPNDAENWSGYGALCMLNGDNACASDAYMRSLAIKPNHGALVNLGNLRFDAGVYDEAASLYRRATQLDPGDYRTWGNLGDALSARPATADQAREPYQRAAQLAQAYIDIKPQDAHAIAVLAWYRANLGQESESRKLIQRASASNVEQGEVAFWAAQSLALIGDGDGARKWLQRALEGGVNRQRIEASPTLGPLLATTAQQRTVGSVR